MPELNFAIGKVGLIVPVMIGLSGAAMSDLLILGIPIPRPISCNGLIDTGSDVTAVAPLVLRALGLTKGAPAQTLTAHGMASTNLHWVSISIFDSAQGNANLTLPDLMVSELPTVLPKTEVLIGLDVLAECDFLLEGKAQRFSLRF